MGYHTYDLAEFDLGAIGRHSVYVLLFSQVPGASTRFADAIGPDAVSITNTVQDADWLFIAGLPD